MGKPGNGKIVAGEYNGEMAKVKAMVDTKSVSWDLVEVESPELSRGCDEDMFEPLDPKLFGDSANYVKGAIQPCGVGFFVLVDCVGVQRRQTGFRANQLGGFLDTKKFPGKRGLREGAKYTLEFALMADGVAPKDVLQSAGRQRWPGPCVQETLRTQAVDPMVGSWRTAAAVPRIG